MTDSLGYVMYMHVIEAIQGEGSILLEVVDHVIDRSMWKSITVWINFVSLLRVRSAIDDFTS